MRTGGFLGRGATVFVLRRGCQYLTLAMAALQAASAEGQLLQRPTFIADARIVTGGGQVIERGSIVVKGGRIEAVGAELEAPFFSRKIDAAGKTVTPGLLDVWSALGTTGSAGDGDATARAWDGFDRYARDDFREALRQGVTTIYIPANGTAGTNGTGAVVRLAPGPAGAAGSVLEEEAALCVNLGSDRSAVGRVKTFAGIRQQFKQAVEYRTSLEDYEEDLKEYLEKLEERRKKEGEKETDDQAEKSNGEKKPSEDEKPAPDPNDDDDDDDDDGDEKDDDGDGGGRGIGDLFGFANRRTLVGDDGSNGDNGGGENGETKGEEGDSKKDQDALKKPEQPAFDPVFEVLLKAIDHKLPVRIEAHRSADILNALALAEEFNLDIVIEGGTEAYLVADVLGEAKIPVVLGQVGRTALWEETEFRRHTARNAEVLSRAGVRWLIGSGGHDPRASRFIGLNAQMATSSAGGGEKDSPWRWVERLTEDASRLLGLWERVGRIDKGMEADLVIWSGDPGAPGSLVERVFVGGRLAYLAPQLAGGGS